VFDRGGFSPKLFKQILDSGFDLLTYRKGRFPRVPRNYFLAWIPTDRADLTASGILPGSFLGKFGNPVSDTMNLSHVTTQL
jgi:hypothetical protein